jgi:hypothetical protein
VLSSAYSSISKEELFFNRNVVLNDKKGAKFDSYSVQVEPGLPGAIARQTENLLSRENDGADAIIELLQYYRGNRFVIAEMERILEEKGVRIRYQDLVKWMLPSRYREEYAKQMENEAATVAAVRAKFNLYRLFTLLGKTQDHYKQDRAIEIHEPDHFDYETRSAQEYDNVFTNYKMIKERVINQKYLYEYIMPLVWRSIKVSIQEYQHLVQEDEEAHDLEELEELEEL